MPRWSVQIFTINKFIFWSSTCRFWSSAPHLETTNPVFLKSALHINIGNLSLAGDDGLVPQSASGRVHSLDSNYTTDVLRWVRPDTDHVHIYNVCVSVMYWRATIPCPGWSWIQWHMIGVRVCRSTYRRWPSSITPSLLSSNTQWLL